jgi:hypothetical protein
MPSFVWTYLLRAYVLLAILMCAAAQLPVLLTLAIAPNNTSLTLGGWEGEDGGYVSLYLNMEGVRWSHFIAPREVPPDVRAAFESVNTDSAAYGMVLDKWRLPGGVAKGHSHYTRQYFDPFTRVPFADSWLRSEVVKVSHVVWSLGIPILMLPTLLVSPVRPATAWWWALLCAFGRRVTGRAARRPRGFPVVQ